MELIDRQAAISALIEAFQEGPAAKEGLYPMEMRTAILGVPVIDGEPIVRCRDCRNYIDEGTEPLNICKVTDGLWRPDDYCSYGRRRG